MTDKAGAEMLEKLRDMGAAIGHVLAEIVGIDLFADPQPGSHQRHADLRSAEPRYLDIGGKRRRPREVGVGERDQNNGQQRKGLPDRLQNNDGGEIARPPLVCQLRSEQTGNRESREADDQHGARIDMPQQKDRQRHRYQHRQRAIDQHPARLFGPHSWPTVPRKFGTSDELDRLVRV